MAKQWFRTALDLKNAYKQILIVPEHVVQSTVTTPDGNMVSHVVQMGNCNALYFQPSLVNLWMYTLTTL